MRLPDRVSNFGRVFSGDCLYRPRTNVPAGLSEVRVLSVDLFSHFSFFAPSPRAFTFLALAARVLIFKNESCRSSIFVGVLPKLRVFFLLVSTDRLSSACFENRPPGTVVEREYSSCCSGM